MTRSAQTQPRNEPIGPTPAVANEPEWERRFWIGFGVIFVARLAWLAISPLDLSGDEAYYWDWGRHLDWGYFSKPPMIGWLMALASATTGATTFGIRVWALLFASGALIWIYRLTKDLYGSKAGLFAAIGLALSPAHTALSQIFTIDPPLMFCWTLALWTSWRLIDGSKWSFRWALTTGLAIAAGTLTKQMMLVFPALLVIFLAIEPGLRPKLRQVRWWALILLPILALVPPILWNASHDWITLRHTGSHFDTHPVGLVHRLLGSLEFVGAQLGMMSPVTGVMALIALVAALRSWSRATRGTRFLLVCSAPALAVFLLLTLRQRVLPNWPAVFVLPLFPLFGAWVAGALGTGAAPQRRRAWAKAALWTGGVFTALFYLACLFTPRLNLRHDPLERVRLWKEYGRGIAAMETKAFGNEPHFVLVGGHRYFASHLAFYHPQHPTVYRWEPTHTTQSQYEIWPGFESSGKRVGLVVIPQKAKDEVDGLLEQFSSVTPIGEFRSRVSEKQERVFALYRVVRADVPAASVDQ